MSLEDRIRNYAEELRLERLRLQSRVSILERVEDHLYALLNAEAENYFIVPDAVETALPDGDVSEQPSQIVHTVESRTRPGVVHTIRLVDPVEGVVLCDCEAGKHGRHCWHIDEYKNSEHNFLAANFGNPFGHPKAVRIPHKETK